MNVNNFLDFYVDYLLVTPNYCAATGLSVFTDNRVNHDQITRLLSSNLDSRTLWREVKAMVHKIRSSEGLLIIDYWIEPKRHTKTNLKITWHLDHCTGKSVKEGDFISSFLLRSSTTYDFP